MLFGEFYKAALFGVRVSRTLERIAFHYGVPLLADEQRADTEVGGFRGGFAGELDCASHIVRSFVMPKGCKTMRRKLILVGMRLHDERKIGFGELIGDF